VDADRVGAIIHCAADIRFGLPIEEARAANVETTRRLEVSTVYAADLRRASLQRLRSRRRQRLCNTYEQSKFRSREGARRRARRAGRNLPAELDQRRFTGSRGAVELLRPGFAPGAARQTGAGVPCDPDASIDLIPSDWAVEAMAVLFAESFEAGRIFHVCAGVERSLSVREIIAAAFGAAGLPMPQLISPAVFADWASEQQSPTMRELLRGVGQFMPHLCVRQSFQPNTGIAPAPPAGTFYPAVIESFLAARSRIGA
jgi:hypothetical protein